MYFDVVLFNKDGEAIKLANKFGFNRLIFKEEFEKLNIIYGNLEIKSIRYNKATILLNPHDLLNKKDNLHYRYSGLNHIICKLAKENDIFIGFSLDKIRDSIELGRVMQNIKLCKKYKNSVCFFTFAKDKFSLRGIHDIMAFCRVLGMDGLMAKNSLLNINILLNKMI
ncbi:hypothetical protein J4436_01265 [Candidatus Woesearchaeota archaeon]|nr:hypothetical protein [Candidatus Woesearchaeota archaeon]